MNEPNYILDPSWIVRPDGSLYLREISIVPNPNAVKDIDKTVPNFEISEVLE